MVEASTTHLRLAGDLAVDVQELVAQAGDLDTQAARDDPAIDPSALSRDLLPDWYEDWVVLERERLRQLRLHALEALCRRLTGAGRFGAAVQAGLASSTTGSLAGQLVLDGLLGWRVPAIARRAVTMVPAIVVLAMGVNEVAALVWSQVALSLALPAVAIPLVYLTSRGDVMGAFANRAPLRRAATAAVVVLVVLNLVLLGSLLT